MLVLVWVCVWGRDRDRKRVYSSCSADERMSWFRLSGGINWNRQCSLGISSSAKFVTEYYFFFFANINDDIVLFWTSTNEPFKRWRWETHVERHSIKHISKLFHRTRKRTCIQLHSVKWKLTVSMLQFRMNANEIFFYSLLHYVDSSSKHRWAVKLNRKMRIYLF